MQLRHQQTILSPPPPSPSSPTHKPYTSRITALTFSPDNTRLAVCSTDRIVSIFDSSGTRVDKFSTKPNAGGAKDYTVRGLAFSPGPVEGSGGGGVKLAVAQSDCIVFVYKWAGGEGGAWEGKKSICNKVSNNFSV